MQQDNLILYFNHVLRKGEIKPWIPTHGGLEGNELVDERAHAAINRPPVTLVDSPTPYSRRFFFDLSLGVKGRTGNLCVVPLDHT
jgi:hypothetical protein